MKGFRESIAILIAVDRYQNGIPELQTPVADANELAKLLRESHGFDAKVYANETASLRSIRALLSGLLDQVKESDRVLFYFAGHGIAIEGLEGPEGYLIPQDADRHSLDHYLSMVELNQALSLLSCRHLLVILDCCFAGALRWSSTRELALAPECLNRERYEWFIGDAAWQAIASAAHDQRALDVAHERPLGKREKSGIHSPFAQALIEGLRGRADRATVGGEGDGVITATELYLHLEEALLPRDKSAVRQTPLFWPLAKHDKGQFVFLVPGKQLDLPPAPALDERSNPWRGLKPYERAHANLFFGRLQAIDRLFRRAVGVEADNGRAANPPERLLVVTGPSGIGKSSLVQAGLLSRLSEMGIESIVVRPGPAPFASLASALSDFIGPAENGPSETKLRTDPWALADWADRRAEIILVVDQAEELITMCRDEDVANAYLGLISNALAKATTFRALLTVRSEFEPQFAQMALRDRWAGARFLVPQMTRDELRRVIEGPAVVKVLRFEPNALVDHLVNEVVQMPGALPLLSFSLSEMYASALKRRSFDRAITRHDYDALEGGVTGSLRIKANEVLLDFDNPCKATARRVLERMISIESGEYARRRVPRREFDVDDGVESERVELVITRFDHARLLVTDEIDGERHLELAHDALIFGWEQLLSWVRQDTRSISDLRRLTRDAEEWAVSPTMQAGRLWADTVRVASIRALEAAPFPGLNSLEQRFAKASVRRARRISNLQKMGVAAVIILAIGATIAAYLANKQTEIARKTTNKLAVQTVELRNQTSQAQEAKVRAEDELKHALSEQSRFLAAAAGNKLRSYEYVEAINLSLEGLPNTRSSERPFIPETARALYDALRGYAMRSQLIGPTNQVSDIYSADISPDGSRAVTGSPDGARMWDLETGRLILKLEDQSLGWQGASGIKSVAYSSDGETILTASASSQGAILLWDKNGAFRGSLREGSSGILRASFSKYDDRILAVTASGAAQMWDVGQKKLIFAKGIPGKKINDAVFSPDGQTFATAAAILRSGVHRSSPEEDQGEIQIWDGYKGTPVKKYDSQRGPCDRVAFSPDGNLLGVAEGDGVTLWDVNNNIATKLSGPQLTQNLKSLSFSDDSSKLAVSASDRRTILWGTQEKGQGRLLEGTWAAFTPDGSRVVTADYFAVKLWNADDGQLIDKFSAPSQHLNLVVLSKDGRRILSAADYKPAAAVWNSEGGHIYEKLNLRQYESESSLRFTIDGLVLIVGDVRKSLFDAASGQAIATFQGLNNWHPEILDFAGGDPRTVITNYSTSVPLEKYRGEDSRLVSLQSNYTPSDHVEKISSTDKRIAVAYGGSDQVELFDTFGKKIAGIKGRGASVVFLKLTDELLMTGFVDGSARYSDLEGREVKSFKGHGEVVRRFDCSRDCRIYATISDKGIVRIQNSQGRETVLKEETKEVEFSRIAMSGDGRSLALALHDSRIMSRKYLAYVVDAETGRNRRVLQGHLGDIRVLQFSYNGKQVVTGSDDGTARIWDSLSGKPLHALEGKERETLNSIRSIAVTEDGSRVATMTEGGTVRIWRTFERQGLIDFAKDVVPRCLSSPDRLKLGLDESPPYWCIAGAHAANDPLSWKSKPPFDSPYWKEWLEKKLSQPPKSGAK